MKSIIFVCAVLASFLSNAQIYRGTIDKYPIVFQYSHDEYNGYAARYYYMRAKTDILLKWKNEDSTVLITDGDKNAQQEEFILKEDGKKITGTWTYKGKTLKVNLTEDPTIKSFSAPKLEGVKMQKLKDEKYNESTMLTWYKEPVTGIEGFRIKSSTKIKDIEKVNKILREHHQQQVQNAIDCIDGAPHGGEYGVSYRLSYLDNNLMSVVWFNGYYCGGAHPDGGENAFSIDLTTMKQLNLRDLYWISNEPYKKVNDDYEMPGYNEIWQSLLNKQYPDQYPMEQEQTDGCVYTPEVWSTGTWYLTPEGLYISSFFPRVARCCDTGNGEPYVSYKLLEKYRVKTNKYIFK